MRALSPAARAAFVRRHTRLQEIPDVPGLRLHVADDVARLWRLTGEALDEPDPPLPYWAFAWSGGLAIARFILDHPDEVAGRRVVDVGSGSGLCAIVAARTGAASIRAIDVDPFAQAAIAVNAAANAVRLPVSGRDPIDEPAPACDLLLAGDVAYERPMAERMTSWLRMAAADGVRVLIGDPGRRYLSSGLELVASYTVRTSREIEASDVTEAAVHTI